MLGYLGKGYEQMDRYMLTDEGRARFRRIKGSADIEAKANTQGYEFLDYLYEHEPATVEEIANNTGLSWGQVVDKLMIFVNRGYVKGFIEKQEK